MAGKKIAIVTGGNKGIGFAIVRGLCQKYDGDVYLTARDEARGSTAVEELKKEGLSPKFHQLDIDDQSSINKLRDFVKDNYGGLDVLVNNAGIAYKMASTAPFSEQAEVTCKTNFWGTLNVCNALFPLLRSHARVVNVSSMVSQMSLGKCSDDAKLRVLSVKNVEEIEAFMTDFVESAKVGKHKDKGWPDSSYGMSKVGVTALSLIQHKNLEADKSREDIVVNACCPGYVSTDMTSHKGHKKVEEGADTPLYLALLPPNVESPRGCFVSERKIGKWE